MLQPHVLPPSRTRPAPVLRPSRAAALACLLALSSRAAAARAPEPHPPVALELQACAGVPPEEVRRLVTVELGAALVSGAGADPREATRVTIDCSPAAEVHVEVRDPTTGKSLDRIITLSGVPRADQARLIAIAAVELMAASWSELRQPSESVPLAVGATASAATRDLALASALRHEGAPTRRRWQLGVVGTVRGVSDLRRPLLGGGLAAQRALGWGLGLGADLIVEGGNQAVPMGDVDMRLLSTGAAALIRADLGALRWESGLGARVGLARLAGRATPDPLLPARGHVVMAPWGGPLALVRGLVALPQRLVLSLAGEAGVVTAGVVGRVDGTPAVSLSGFWWSAVLGVGFAQ